MKKIQKNLLATALPLALFSQTTMAANADQQNLSLIPWPAEIAYEGSEFTLTSKTAVCAADNIQTSADMLKYFMNKAQGLALTKESCSKAGVRLQLTKEELASDEAYILDVTKKGITISANAEAGLFNGIATLAQLASSNADFGNNATIPGVHIEDWPAFDWRGLMLDPSRHFVPVESVKSFIDQMAQLKFNKLHIHLADDQGWRIEIKKYPKLTEVGAWRKPPSNGNPEYSQGTYGGFYTQDDIREIVAYAASRHITVIPEIDMPGHAQAAVASYPEIVGVTSDKPEVSADWGINYYLFNPNEKSMAFIKDVLDEVMDLFPGEYIHLGGDEAPNDQWEASPEVQAQMKSLGIETGFEMQGWFMSQLGNYLAEHGRKMIGWDEVLEGNVPSSTTIMSWRGNRGAIEAAQKGHDVVQSLFYINHLATHRADDPSGRISVTGLSKIYKTDITPAALTVEEKQHILGVQGHLWSEYIMTPWYLEYLAFPRAAAIAEIAWTPVTETSWSSFLDRMPEQIARYDEQNVVAGDGEYAADFGLMEGRNGMLESGSGELVISNQLESGNIRYTTDGSEPTTSSPLYSKPIKVSFGDRVRSATFDDQGRVLAKTRDYTPTEEKLRTRISGEFRTCYGGDFGLRVPLTADSGAQSPVYDIDIFHDCFVYPEAEMSGISSLKIDKARLARNYALAHEAHMVKSYPWESKFGDLVVYLDKCESGEEVARVALENPAVSPNQNQLTIPLEKDIQGEHDLCFLFASPLDGPFHAIGSVTLQP